MGTLAGQITLDFRSSEPLYIQIVRMIEQLVVSGELCQGDQLPTVRQLATELRINFNTVARAYRILDEAGLISTQRGRGTYIWKAMDEGNGQSSRKKRLEELTARYFEEVKRFDFSKEEVEENLLRQLRSWNIFEEKESNR